MEWGLIMAATKEDIIEWLERGKKQGATHLIVVVDEYDWEDYPVFVKPGENVREIEHKYIGSSMQKVMEVYSYAVDLEKQLTEHRSFHYE
jgi:hypothetical protein